jgi:hypothetical protein
MNMNNNWKNPTVWIVVTLLTAASIVASKYLAELAEKGLKERKLWPEVEVD